MLFKHHVEALVTIDVLFRKSCSHWLGTLSHLKKPPTPGMCLFEQVAEGLFVIWL